MTSQDLLDALPQDSLLHDWVRAQRVLETHDSFSLAMGCSGIGAILKRTCWIDQLRFKVFPNLSVLLVGPSGSGKDIAINSIVRAVRPLNSVPIIGGKTSESILDTLAKIRIGPACGIIQAGEMAEFFGGKEYQKDMTIVMTDLLSTNDSKDISLKSTGTRVINEPTITLLAGSTKEWLHDAMPGHTMTGGFYPRLLILVEGRSPKLVSWVKYQDKQLVEDSNKAFAVFAEGLKAIASEHINVGELIPSEKARDIFTDWYNTRYSIFEPSEEAYAHRCRDNALRLGMICAISRLQHTIEAEDLYFATQFMNYVAERVAQVLAPPTVGARIAKDLLELCPIETTKALAMLRKRYDLLHITRTIEFLERQTGELSRKDGQYYKVQRV